MLEHPPLARRGNTRCQVSSVLTCFSVNDRKRLCKMIVPRVPVAFPASGGVSGLPCSPSHVRCRQMYGDALCHLGTDLHVRVHCVKTFLSYFPAIPSVIKQPFWKILSFRSYLSRCLEWLSVLWNSSRASSSGTEPDRA